MSTQGHIYLFGLIGSNTDLFSTEPSISPSDIQKAILENKSADGITLHISSRGGSVYDAFTMYDLLTQSGKTVTTIIEGICASAATIPFLAGDIRQMTQFSELMIHNPWMGVEGDATQLRKSADQLQNTEDK